MSTKLFRILFTNILAIVVAIHFKMYYNNTLSELDFFICIIGYLSVWSILMMFEFKDDVDI